MRESNVAPIFLSLVNSDEDWIKEGACESEFIAEAETVPLPSRTGSPSRQ